MNSYRIFQAQILAKDPTTPRQYSVIEIPNGQKLVGVQLGNALKDQSAPLLGSLVLVLQLDMYQSYILMIIREPFAFVTANNQFRGAIPSTGNVGQDILNGANPIQDGEIFMEATGPSSPTGESTPGFGAHLYLGNNGVAQIESGSMGERLIIGGEGTADDHEVILSADNGYFESNTGTDNIQSTFNYTTNSLTGLTEGLQIATQINIPTTDVGIPIAQLTMDTIGNISLNNTVFGTGAPLAFLTMDPVGDITLHGTTVSIQGTVDLSLQAPVISLNGGTGQGVARLGDLAISNSTIDPVYWQFITAIQAFFTSIAPLTGGGPVTQSQLGALGLAFLAQSPIAPPSLTSKISTASVTVTAGD
jgi:hypothetical protein